MTARTPTLVAVGAGVGAFSGFFGVGGGIMLVPYLALKQGLGQKAAQATSLILVVMGAATGVLTYALNSAVAWLEAPWVIAGGLVGAGLGSAVVHRMPDDRLRKAFAILIVLVSVRMFFPTQATITSGSEVPDLTVSLAIFLLMAGVVMGILSSLFGIGGGIILIPLLVAVLSFSPQLAAGTSLAVMVPIAMLGAWRQRRVAQPRVGVITGVGAAIGAPLGAWAAVLLPVDILRVGFAFVLLFVAVQMYRSAKRV